MIPPLLASGAGQSGGSHCLVVVVVDVILCSNSYADVSRYAFLTDNGTASLALSSVKYFSCSFFLWSAGKKRSETYKTFRQHEAIYLVQNPLGLEQEGTELLLDWQSWLSLCLTCLVQMGVSVLGIHFLFTTEYFTLCLADHRQHCCWWTCNTAVA